MERTIKLVAGVLFFIVLCFLTPEISRASQPQIAGTTSGISVQAVSVPVVESVTNEVKGWLVIPFICLLLMIATGPLFYEDFWHRNYERISISLGLLVILYYVFILKNTHSPINSIAEYIQFISLLTGLFIASGGILINVDKKATPFTNVILLFAGAVISNVIGTTGASMLLIRPLIRINKNRIKPYHIIFFIFVVSNVGGSLTPIGDPPLFLGFLKGVPFFWTLLHNFPYWVTVNLLLLAIFYFIDIRNKADLKTEQGPEYTNKITLKGKRNFIWLGLIVVAVFLDPNVFPWVPGISYMGQKISFIREIVILTVAALSYHFANKEALAGNEFNFEPIKEVAFLFLGIFATMMPALELVGAFAASSAGQLLVNHNTLYWGSGTLSSFLDNAPTYLNFLAAGMSAAGADINKISDVAAYAKGLYPSSIINLTAISIGSVFFGAMTYIGNGPNFMIKSIAEHFGISMPSFFGYIFKYSLIILLPVLVVIWLIFFAHIPV